jgi:NAD(P)-dependent dehydrogenase (short-subunit alcohol dehydrogenase family)
MDVQGKNILVVGGSSGIGLALVKLLAANGAQVYNVSRNEANGWPDGVKHLQADVTADVSGITAFLPEKLHGLVYSVGSINLKPFGRLTTDDFLQDYKLNVLGAVEVLQQSLKSLKAAQGASVVLMSSVATGSGMSFHASIASAKGAVEGLALALAAELASVHVRVNVVAPSLTDTPLAQALLATPEKQEASAKRHPLSRYGKPEDIAQAVAYLLSADSSWVTGQVLGVDGGLGKLR